MADFAGLHCVAFYENINCHREMEVLSWNLEVAEADVLAEMTGGEVMSKIKSALYLILDTTFVSLSISCTRRVNNYMSLKRHSPNG